MSAGVTRKKTSDGFGQRLRELRKQKNLSQTELGNLAGLHFTHLSRYERGESRPTADALKRLATVLGVSGDYLLEGTVTEAADQQLNNRKLLRLFEDVEKLSKTDQDVIVQLIEAFIMRRSLQRLVHQSDADQD